MEPGEVPGSRMNEAPRPRHTHRITIACAFAILSVIAMLVASSFTSEVTIGTDGMGYVDGGGYYHDGATVTVTAEAEDGCFFEGWYDDGVLVSTDESYTFKVTKNSHLEARFIPGSEDLTLRWDTDAGSGSVHVVIPGSSYHEYREGDIARDYRTLGGDCISFVTPDDGTIREIAAGVMEATAGFTDLERVECVLDMVRGIPTSSDEASTGHSDYFRYPVETLWELTGDCEDHAILLSSILEAMGYDTVLHYVNIFEDTTLVGSHMAAGVGIDGASGSYVSLHDMRFWYCEPSPESGDLHVGEVPEGYVVWRTYEVVRSDPSHGPRCGRRTY